METTIINNTVQKRFVIERFWLFTAHIPIMWGGLFFNELNFPVSV